MKTISRITVKVNNNIKEITRVTSKVNGAIKVLYTKS